MFKRTTIVKMMACTVVLAALAGCGSNPANDELLEDPGMDSGMDPYAGGGALPGTGGALPGTGGALPGAGGAAGGGAYCGGGGATTTPVGGELTASVTKKKNGSFLGMGKYSCTVEVSNPSPTQRTGTLTVTFKNGSKTSSTAPVTHTVTLGPNETKTFDFTDKKWSTDNVEAEITTDAAPAAAATTGTCAAGASTGAMAVPGAALPGMPAY